MERDLLGRLADAVGLYRAQMVEAFVLESKSQKPEISWDGWTLLECPIERDDSDPKAARYKQFIALMPKAMVAMNGRSGMLREIATAFYPHKILEWEIKIAA